MTDFWIAQGDTASPIDDVLRDAAGAAVNLQGANVLARLVPLRGGDPIVERLATVTQVGDGSDGSKGRVRLSWQAGETDDPGLFLLVWVATFAGGAVQTFPNSGYLLVQITADAPITPGRYLTLEELKHTLKLTGKDYADAELEVCIASAADALDELYGGPWTLGVPGEVRYFTPAHSRSVIDLRQIVDVDQVALDESGGGTFSKVLVDGTDYRLEANGAPSVTGPWDALRLLRTGFAYSWEYDPVRYPYPWGVDSLRVTGQWGWAEVPAGVKAASSLIATRLFRRKREAPFGVVGLDLEGNAQRAMSIAKDPDVQFAMARPRARRRHVV